MAADFTPNLNPYSGQGSFRFWVQKVLPLVYDDSLSYYELLCKVVTFLNNVIQDMDTAEENIELIRDAYNQLQNYVNTYFDNLDIEAELDAILMKWVEDGRLEDALTTTLTNNPSILDGPVGEAIPGVVSEQLPGVVAEQIDDAVSGAIEEQVPPAVSDWLNANVEPVGSAVIVDASLSVSGAAADAKVTGDRIAEEAQNTNTKIEKVEKDVGMMILTKEDGTIYNYTISATNTINKTGASAFQSVEIPRNADWKYLHVETIQRIGYVTFLTGSCGSLDSGDTAPVIGNRNEIPANSYGDYVIPDECTVISIATNSTTDRTPKSIVAYYNAGAYYELNNKIDTDYSGDAYSDSVSVGSAIESNGHMRVYTIDNKEKMIAYDENKNEKSIILGSKFIKIKTGDIINFMCGASNVSSVTNNQTAFIIYFYGTDYNIKWDVIDYFDADLRNKITVSNFIGLTGGQIVSNFNGFIRISKVNNFDMYIGLWDGVTFGLSLSGASTTITGAPTGTAVKLPNVGESAVLIPPKAKFAIAKPGYHFVRGYSALDGGAIRNFTSTVTLFPSNCVRLSGYTGDLSVFKNLILRKVIDDSDRNNIVYADTILCGDVSDYVSVIYFDQFFEKEKVIGKAYSLVKRRAELLTNEFKWTPVKDIICNDQETYFKAGIEVSGVPYRSSWVNPNLVGWNVTKQTFMSAVKDPDSIFYNGYPVGSARPGPYYSLVCSSFGTLVNGFDYPSTNYDLVHNPNYNNYFSTNPVLGACMTNGFGHCLTFLEKTYSTKDYTFSYKVAEGMGPSSRIRSGFNGKPASNPLVGVNDTYINNFNTVVYPNHLPSSLLTPYNTTIGYGENANKMARPDHGDYSEYTDLQDVIINVKDFNATYISYCEFNASANRGIISGDAVPVSGTIKHVNISENTLEQTENSIRVMLSNHTTPNNDLEDGKVYGVWASANAEDRIPEDEFICYFEYHRVSEHPIVYSIDDGKLVIPGNDSFWYAFALGTNQTDNYTDNYRDDKKSGTVTIPYEPPRKSMDGTITYNSDYSKYRERYYITQIYSFVKKGKFGAYKVDNNQTEPEPEEP